MYIIVCVKSNNYSYLVEVYFLQFVITFDADFRPHLCPYAPMPRITSALRNISLFILLFVLIYIYAGMSEQIALFTDSVGSPSNYVSRNTFFYLSLAIIAIVNGVFLAYSEFMKVLNKGSNQRFIDSMKIWSNGLLTLLNLFFITAIIFLSAFNSLAKFDFYKFGLVIYVVLGLTFLWTLGIIKVLIEKNKM